VGPFRTDSKGNFWEFSNEKQPAKGGDQHASVFFQLLPYLDQNNLWLEKPLSPHQQVIVPTFQCPSTELKNGQSGFAFNAGNVDREALVGLIAPMFRGKRDAGAVKLNYGVVNGQLQKIDGGRGWKTIPDGESNTLLLAERAQTPCNDFSYVHGRPSSDSSGNLFLNSSLYSGLEGPPLQPGRATELLVSCSTQAGANHGDVTIVTTMDGAGRQITCDVDHAVWKAMNGIADGKSLNLNTERPEILSSPPIGGEIINQLSVSKH
jgi:hypothetical protein